MKEEILLFGRKKSLVGIVTGPGEKRDSRPGIILLNAGLIHRVGPNRLYVAIARKLAALGFVVLRFDFSGAGDSRAREDHLPIEQSVVDEVQEAMKALNQVWGIEQFVLIGHCSGAGISFKVACEDPRVVGTILINPQGGDEEWEAYDRNRKQAQYYTNYYTQALFSNPQKL
jgi:alpha-beta hydrolase superfamily lysophospholipase